MDYVIICRVVELLNECGMTDEELSFLLGKANNYVFGFIAKPSDKNRFTEDQLDVLPYLLSSTFRQLILMEVQSSMPLRTAVMHRNRISSSG